MLAISPQQYQGVVCVSKQQLFLEVYSRIAYLLVELVPYHRHFNE